VADLVSMRVVSVARRSYSVPPRREGAGGLLDCRSPARIAGQGEVEVDVWFGGGGGGSTLTGGLTHSKLILAFIEHLVVFWLLDADDEESELGVPMIFPFKQEWGRRLGLRASAAG
jgi:hypothetical protein